MTVISGVAPVALPAPLARTPQNGGRGFTVPRLTGGTDTRPSVAQTGMATAINGAMVLALQEQVGRDTADEDGRRHGHLMLDELARLQRALLSDGNDSSLQSLAELARGEPGNVDPALAGVLSSIRLRARIELERRSRQPGPRLTNG